MLNAIKTDFVNRELQFDFVHIIMCHIFYEYKFLSS